MAEWFCSSCGTDFDAPGISEIEVCPCCGRELYGDPIGYVSMLEECGYDV